MRLTFLMLILFGVSNRALLLAGGTGDQIQLTSENGQIELRLGTHIQFDGRYLGYAHDGEPLNSFLIRRNRLILCGMFYKYIDFKVMPDFSGDKISLLDAYFDIHMNPSLNLRVGMSKVPFGLEFIQSPVNTLFIERALAINLVPKRDTGLQFYGQFAGALSYQIGVVNGVNDGYSGDAEMDHDKDVAARLFWTPFSERDHQALSGLSLGIAGTFGQRNGDAEVKNLSVYKSPAQQTVFCYSLTDGAANLRLQSVQRLSPQFTFYRGSFGLIGEMVWSSHELQTVNRTTLNHTAWNLSASCLLTGEHATFKTVQPVHNFDPQIGTRGAFEVTVRIHHLNIDDTAFPVYADPDVSVSKITAFGVGLNWYLNPFVRIMVNYESAVFIGGSVDGDRDREHMLFTRFQLQY